MKTKISSTSGPWNPLYENHFDLTFSKDTEENLILSDSCLKYKLNQKKRKLTCTFYAHQENIKEILEYTPDSIKLKLHGKSGEFHAIINMRHVLDNKVKICGNYDATDFLYIKVTYYASSISIET